jgi:hypothetical protein
MSEPREVELWPCPSGYTVRCSVHKCPQRATMILRFLDDQGRLESQTEACIAHATELCAGLTVIDRRLPSG